MSGEVLVAEEVVVAAVGLEAHSVVWSEKSRALVVFGGATYRKKTKKEQDDDADIRELVSEANDDEDEDDLLDEGSVELNKNVITIDINHPSRDEGSKTWTAKSRTVAQIDAPEQRTSGTVFHSSSEDKSFLFGGLDSELGVWLNDMHTFDHKTGKWSSILTDSESARPSPRDKTASCQLSDHLFVLFGGFGADQDPEDDGPDYVPFRWFNDLWLFDSQTTTWTELTVDSISCDSSSSSSAPKINAPTPRAASSLTLLHSDLASNTHHAVLFGGKDYSGRKNDLWQVKIDTATKTASWTCVSVANPPPARSFHTASLIASNKILLVGGLSVDDRLLGDAFILTYHTERDSFEWNKASIYGGKGLQPRALHAAVSLTPFSPHIALIGGVSKVDPETNGHDSFHENILFLSLGSVDDGDVDVKEPPKKIHKAL